MPSVPEQLQTGFPSEASKSLRKFTLTRDSHDAIHK